MKKFAIILLFLAACKSKPASTVLISVNHTQKTVEVKGIPATEIYGLKTDTISIAAWQSLFPVFKMPADTDLRNYQSPVAGKYQIVDNAIRFTPDTAFSKDSTYFARYYRFADGLNSTDMLIDKRKPGEARYTELIFKY